jgi:tRNA pseudouridine38-40 synthase
MPPYRITLAYDGTDFAGWQAQVRGGTSTVRTVQGVVENALAALGGGERVAVAGAGRTDTGVHAFGQVASFTLAREMAGGDLLRALNALLPEDVRVLRAAACGPDFHARRSAVAKVYRYVCDTGPLQLPTRRRQAGHVAAVLDPARVAEAAALFPGRRDFASLASSGSSVRTTVRTVTRSEVWFEEPPDGGGGPVLVYEVEADGFLRKMVRSMVGGLLAAGRGARVVEDLRAALSARDRRAWPPPAEARGLTLVRVLYGPGTEG